MQEQRSMIRKQGSWEIGEVDQVKIGSVVEDGEGGAFDFARGEQPGVCGGQGGVVVARVGDEFETAFAGQSPQKGGEGGAVESPCGEDAERAIGGLEAVFLHEAAEAGGAQQPEEADLGAADDRSAGSGANAPCRLEGIAYGPDAAGARGAEDGAQYAGEHVRVLVGVDVGEIDATGLKGLDLGEGFGFDFVCMEFAADQAEEEISEGGMKSAGSRVGECGESGGRGRGTGA